MSITPKERDHYFIRLDTGDICEVSREVYLCYYAGERQERYQAERDRRNGLVSIEEAAEKMFDDGNGCGCDFIASNEESVPEQVYKKMLIEQLYIALDRLNHEDRQLITALYFDNVSVRTYAKTLGVSRYAVEKRRDEVLVFLRKFFR